MSLLILFTYIKIKEFRKKPGDIFLITAIIDIICTTNGILTALWSRWGPVKHGFDVDTKETFCLVTGGLEIITSTFRIFR